MNLIHILRAFGSSMPPATPVLAVAGSTATISGSTPGSTNTVSVAAFSGAGSLNWMVVGSRTGDGTVSLGSLAAGSYFARCDSTLAGDTSISNLVYITVVGSGVQIATDESTILTAIMNKLVTDGVFTASTLFISLNPEEQPINPPSTLYGVICPGEGDAPAGFIRGGGRQDTVIEWNIEIYVISNTQLDEGDRDNSWLTDNSLGAYAVRNSVLDSLCGFYPTDGNGNLLLMEPLLLKRKGAGRRPGGKFGALPVSFVAKYVQSLPTPGAY